MKRNIHLIIVALGIQSLQSSIVFLTLAWFFINITHSPLVFSSLMAFRYIPGILLAVLSGILIDRFNKISLGLWASVWHLFTLCALFAIGLMEVVPSGFGYWIYCLVLLFMGVASAILTPLERTLIPLLTPPEELKSVNSVITAITQIANLLGTAIAGGLLVIGGFTVAMLTSIILILLSVVCYVILRYRAVLKDANNQDTNRIQTPIKVTFSILKRQKWIFSAITAAVFTNMAFVMIMDVLLPTLYSEIKVNGSAALGLCFTAIGIGTLLGATITYKIKQMNFEMSIVLYVLSGVVGTIAGFVVDSTIMSIVLFGVFGLLAAPVTIIFQTELQQAIPQNIMGSAMGFLTAGATLAQPIGVFIAGVFLLKLNGSYVLAISCSISIIAVVMGWYRINKQKKLISQEVMMTKQTLG
ncbi:MFS transporter [Peribacillus sp. NPDC097264]|uniref:MFS transporter n=1 Tax=Peribacillus sp. NPDC097264 TaxID=3390616 RepID=UPI003D06BE1C